MATAYPPPNIWTQMAYTPPRGPCSQKTSLVSTCACHRFMIHPLKASTSYDCDGCGHHASFHAMENSIDKQVITSWRTGERDEREGEMRRNLRRLLKAREVGDDDGRRLAALLGMDDEDGDENSRRAGAKRRRIGGREVDGGADGRIRNEDAEEDEGSVEVVEVVREPIVVGRKRKGRGTG